MARASPNLKQRSSAKDDETALFLRTIAPRLLRMDTEFHNGDPALRHATWSHHEPVTLYGAALMKSGWNEVGPAFDFLASRFSDCRSFESEVVAAGASNDLAYIVAIERTHCSVGGKPPERYALRVTTVFRREEGDWKIVHRHADPLPESVASTRRQLARFGPEKRARPGGRSAQTGSLRPRKKP